MARLKSPFIMKVRFYDPNENQLNPQKNSAHILYIGTRSGVALDENEDRFLEVGADGGDQDSRVIAELNPDSAAWHVKYAHERPGSHGLFSSGEEGGAPDLQEIQKELQNHSGIVWRMILSLREDDALRLGYDEKAQWVHMLRSTVPIAAQKMGIKETNLRWVAAFHQEQGHPHVHLVLWEKNPTRSKGLLSPGENRDVKRAFVTEIYAEDRTRLFQDKTLMRDLLRDIAKGDLYQSVEMIRELRSSVPDINLFLRAGGENLPLRVGPKLYPSDQKELAIKLQDLADMMPEKGRIAFQYMPDEVKKEALNVAKWLLKQPAMRESFDRYIQSVEDMTKIYTLKSDAIRSAVEKAEADLLKRISQIVIRGAAESKKDILFDIMTEKAQKVIEQFSIAIGKPEDNIPEDVILAVSVHLRDMGFTENEQLQIFLKWQEQADLKIPYPKIESMVREIAGSERRELEEEEVKQNIQIVSRVLRLSGYSQEEVQDMLLQKVPAFDTGEMKEVIKGSEKQLLAANESFLKEKDWIRLSDIMGIKQDYPWEMTNEQEILEDKVSKAIESIQQASLKEPEEAGWTAFTMAVALKQMKVDPETRESIISDWALRNRANIRDLEGILNKVEEAETNFLRKPTWEKLCENINIQEDYPWKSTEELVLNQEKLTIAIKKWLDAVPVTTDQNDIQWAVSKIAQLLKNTESSLDTIKQTMENWLTKVQPSSPVNLNQIFESIKLRSMDLEIMRKQFGIEDYVQKTVTNFAKVLFAAGLSKEQVTEMIVSWNVRSNANLEEQRMAKYIEAAERHYTDVKSWGRVPILSKKDFNELLRTLGVDAPYMWQSMKKSQMNLANTIWKAVWRSMEKERMKAEAQVEYQKKQDLERKRLVKEQDQERER